MATLLVLVKLDLPEVEVSVEVKAVLSVEVPVAVDTHPAELLARRTTSPRALKTVERLVPVKGYPGLQAVAS